jgi:hypothetical protein
VRQLQCPNSHHLLDSLEEHREHVRWRPFHVSQSHIDKPKLKTLRTSSPTIPTSCERVTAASSAMCVSYTSPGVAANTGGRNGPASSSRRRSPVFWFPVSSRANGGTSDTAAYVKQRRRFRRHYCAICALRCAMHSLNGRTMAQQIRRPGQVGQILRQCTCCYVTASVTASGSRYHAYRRVGRSPHGIYSAVYELIFAIDLLNQDPDLGQRALSRRRLMAAGWQRDQTRLDLPRRWSHVSTREESQRSGYRPFHRV